MLIFAQAYMGRNFIVRFLGELKKPKILSKLTDLYLINNDKKSKFFDTTHLNLVCERPPIWLDMS